MPISEKYKIIFVHIPKTAGSSIDKMLDLHGSDNEGSLKPDTAILYGVKRSRWGHRQKALQHLTAAQIKKKVGKECFSHYFKFAFVRNPYDRVVSDWFFMNKVLRQELSLKEYLVNYVLKTRKKWMKWGLYDDHFSEQYSYIYDASGNLLVDFIGRFETLSSDWQKVCEYVGINKSLLHLNKGDRRDYRHYFDQETKRLTEELFKKDIEFFEYEF